MDSDSSDFNTGDRLMVWNKDRKYFKLLLPMILLLGGFLSIHMDCDETLPPYEDPGIPYTIFLKTGQPNPLSIHRAIESTMVGKGALGFTVDVKNVYDETLADTVQTLLGKITIWWDDNPWVSRTFLLKQENEIVTHEIQWDGQIVFDPGDSLRFAVIWPLLKDDQGRFMWEHLKSYWSYEGEEIFPWMNLTVQAEIQLFKQTATAYSNLLALRILFEHESNNSLKHLPDSHQ
jgi:hypothetical protein